MQGNKIFLFKFIYLFICDVLHSMNGLSASNELKRLCKEVIKAFTWGDVRSPPKNLNVVCVPYESCEI